MKKLTIFIATGFSFGYAPFASGTVGTLAGIICFIPFLFLNPVIYFWCLGLFTVLACWTSGVAEEHFQEKDSGRIVVDEITGYLFTMFLVPISFNTTQEIFHDLLPKVVAGYFLFRLTDIVKPFPARWIDQKMGGGCGVVLDDVVAGIYANFLLHTGLFIWTRV